MPAHNSEGHWLGGRDLTAGGTWLGVNRTGLIVAVTNRKKSDMPVQPQSRGLLCRALLEQGSLESAEAEFHRQWKSHQFAGFNLMLISSERGVIVSAGDDLCLQPLTPGQHAITNRDWDDPADKRLARVRSLVQKFPGESANLDDWIRHAASICTLGEDTPGDAICIPCTASWGTVSSSIVALTADPNKSRYLHAAGSPATIPYRDYSPLLFSLLTES